MKVTDLFEKLSPKELNWLDHLADNLFSDLGIDVEFTKHFFDRANDERSDYRDRLGKAHEQGITADELAAIFIAAHKNAKEGNPRFTKITDIPAGKEGVITDFFSKINIPFVIQKDGKGKTIVPKTVMRKDKFTSPPGVKSVPVNSKDVVAPAGPEAK